MKSLQSNSLVQTGFTIIELVMVIVILGILAAFALPRFADFSSAARIATLEGIEGAMKSTIAIVRSKAYANGLSVTTANPGDQSAYLVTTEAGTSEVDWRNLCPESRAELGDNLNMFDHIDFDQYGSISGNFNNRYTWMGYDLVGTSLPSGPGCYLVYDSFGDPNCTVTVRTDEC